MERRPSMGDLQRNRELHELLDQIEVPDESLSEMSISGRSVYEPDANIYQQTSPGRQIEDFFDSSINSTIAHTSQLENARTLNFDESRVDSNNSQPQSRAFTPKQISKMMNWSKTHITQAEGLFPQVSAPSMSIEQDIDFWDQSQNDTSMPANFMRPHSSIEFGEKHRTSIKRSDSVHGLPALDLPTHIEDEEVLTFSPGKNENN